SSLYTVSSSFAGSQEFKTTYGSLTNSQFVTLVYNNVLGRSPDTSGLNYWVGQLNNGESRGQVMVGFSESAENVTKTGAEVDVIGVYHSLLLRVPTQSELTTALNRVSSGTTFATIVAGVYGSAAYAARIGGTAPPAIAFGAEVRLDTTVETNLA